MNAYGSEHDRDRTAQAGGQRETRSFGARHEAQQGLSSRRDSEAIASYVDLNAWQVAHIKNALEEDRPGAAGIPHEDIVAWIESGRPITSFRGRRQKNHKNSWRSSGDRPPSTISITFGDTLRKTTLRRALAHEH
jgi:hypothetical protein